MKSIIECLNRLFKIYTGVYYGLSLSHANPFIQADSNIKALLFALICFFYKLLSQAIIFSLSSQPPSSLTAISQCLSQNSAEI